MCRDYFLSVQGILLIKLNVAITGEDRFAPTIGTSAYSKPFPQISVGEVNTSTTLSTNPIHLFLY
jgi:hypothetical protein